MIEIVSVAGEVTGDGVWPDILVNVVVLGIGLVIAFGIAFCAGEPKRTGERRES